MTRDEPAEDEEQAPPRPRRSTGAAMLGAAMLGLEKAIYGEKEERPGIVVDAPGEPPNDLPFQILLDPDHPERSIVLFTADTQETENTEEPPASA